MKSFALALLVLAAYPAWSQETEEKRLQSGFSIGAVDDLYTFSDGANTPQQSGQQHIGFDLGIHVSYRITDYLTWRPQARITFHNRDLVDPDDLRLFIPQPPVLVDHRWDFMLSMPHGKLQNIYLAPTAQVSLVVDNGSIETLPEPLFATGAAIGYTQFVKHVYIIPEISYTRGLTGISSPIANPTAAPSSQAYLNDFRFTLYFRSAKTKS